MKELTNEPDEPPVEGEEEIPEVYKTPQEPTQQKGVYLPTKRAIKIEVITDEIKKRIKEDPDRFRTYSNPFTSARTITYGLDNLRNSIWKLIRDVARNIPSSVAKGPFNVMGSDGKIIIHNGQHNQSAMLRYVWNGGNGELLSFDVSDDFTESTVEVVQQSTIDGDTKEVKTTTVQTTSKEVQTKGEEVVWLDNKFFQDPRQQPKWNEKDKTRVDSRGYVALPTEVKKATTITYKSDTDAKNQIRDSYRVTQEDVDLYLSTLKQKYEEFSNASNSGDITTFTNLLRKSNTLDDYVIKKKVTVKKQINPIDISGLYDNKKYNRLDPASTKNVDMTTWWYEGFKRIVAAGYTIVPKREKYPTANNYGYSARDLDAITVLEEIEVEIPISGARVLASPFMESSMAGVGGDIVKKTENEVKATAQLLGHPLITCSRVIEIDNVGQRYSGDWYVKKVTHEMSNGDYTCNVDFKKKSLLISKVTYDQKIPTQNIYTKINKTAVESINSGVYLTYPRVKAYIEKVKESSLYKGKSLLVDVVSKVPLVINIYDANIRFDVSKPLINVNLDKNGEPNK